MLEIKSTNYPIPSGAFFVASDGSETNTGREVTSPCSLNKALSIAPAGSTIILRHGTYRTSAVIRKKLTLQPYPNEKVWFKGSIVLIDSNWVAEGSIWRVDNWNYSFPSNLGSEYIDPQYPLAGYRDMVFINDAPLKQVGTKPEVALGKFFVDSINKKLYIGSNPVRSYVEATTRLDGITFQNTSTSNNGSDSVLRGLGFAHYANAGIGVGAARVTLENNTSIYNGIEGASFWGGGVAVDCIIRGNTFSYNGRKGLSGSRAHRMLLENNLISYNNIERFDTRWDAAGIKVVKTDGLVWRNNLVANNFASGMWFDISSTNSTVVKNIVRNNERYGIFMELSHLAIIASNLVYDNASGIHLTNSSAAQIYNNTLAQNGHNLHIDDQPGRRNTEESEIASGATWVARDNVVKNNLMSSPSSRFSDTLQFQATCENASAYFMFGYGYDAINNNGYYRPTIPGKRSFRWRVSSQNKAHDQMSLFQLDTGYEDTSLWIGDMSPNPLFVDETLNDYRLREDAPARGRGVPLPADVAEALNVQAGVPVNLGVFH